MRKDELKAEYKQSWHRLRTMGVYQVKNRLNGKVYLDASLNLEGALDKERFILKLGSHYNKQLQADWNALGPDAFEFSILEVLAPSDEPLDYKSELAVLLEVCKDHLQPYGDQGYMPAPKR